MTRSMRLAHLEGAVIERSEELLDELDGGDRLDKGQRAAMAELAAAHQALEAYCEDCDDTGVVAYVHGAGTPSCEPDDIREKPCPECEPGRVIQAGREADRVDEQLAYREAV